MRSAQIEELETLEALSAEEVGTSWLMPSVSNLLPDVERFGPEGLSINSLRRAFERSDYGLRLIGYPLEALEKLLISRRHPLHLVPKPIKLRLPTKKILMSSKKCPSGRTLMVRRF